jgi:hypothetical protein
MMKLPFMDKLGSVGFVGERKALALLCLGFYTTLFFMIALQAGDGGMPEWTPVFTAMTLMYATAFFAVGAEWFWGRWFATGLGHWGLTMMVLAWVQTRQLPTALLVFGVMHGLISICLGGEKMASLFDAKPSWRERWKLDEQGVIRVRKSVTRAASSLPALIMFALAPRPGEEMLGLAAFALVVTGFAGVLINRAYGVLALIAGAGITGALVVFGSQPSGVSAYFSHEYFISAGDSTFSLIGIAAAVLVFAAALPFVKPMTKYILNR